MTNFLKQLRTDHGLLLLVAISIFATALYFPAHPFVDEYIHWPTAQQFAHGKWPLNPEISTWPTMNAVVGWTTALLGQSAHILAGRLVIAAFALLAIAGFYRVTEEFDASTAGLRTAQFFLSPIVLPFCALIYTDLPALSCMLWAMVGALRGQAWLLVGAGFLACAFRQNDIVWFTALATLFCWMCWRAGEAIRAAHIIAILLVMVAWLTAVGLQGGIASGLSTQIDHPGELKGIPNIEFALIIASIIYLPYFGFRLFTEKRSFKVWIFFLIGMGVALTFHVTHRLNLVAPHYFIRNDLLQQTFFPLGMTIFVLIATTAAMLFSRTPLAHYEELRNPLLLFSALSLLPFWLIEQRYYLPIFALFWAMRAAVDRRVEITQLIFGAACSVWIVVRIALGFNFL